MNIALITGASGGLGSAVSDRLARSGWKLALAGRDGSRLADRGKEGALVIEADVSTPEGAQAAIEACADELGGPPQALAHCAGAVLIQSLHATKPEQYRECLRANLDSAFFMLGAFIGGLVKARAPGAAALVSTVAARIGIGRHEAVAAAKAGVEGLVRSAAASYSEKGIRVNAVAPGLMRTPATERFFSSEKMTEQLNVQYPLGRHGTADDVAGAMEWLLSPEAAWVTGQVLPVDGGFTAVRPLVR
jgi:NAD(P)-dependent dehydrogenase (short-subunit alcohol dehydrogenase family)